MNALARGRLRVQVSLIEGKSIAVVVAVFAGSSLQPSLGLGLGGGGLLFFHLKRLIVVYLLSLQSGRCLLRFGLSFGEERVYEGLRIVCLSLAAFGWCVLLSRGRRDRRGRFWLRLRLRLGAGWCSLLWGCRLELVFAVVRVLWLLCSGLSLSWGCSGARFALSFLTILFACFDIGFKVLTKKGKHKNYCLP